MAFLTIVVLLLAAYRLVHVPSLQNAAEFDFEANDGSSQAEAPSVPPPPPLPASSVHRRLAERPPRPSGRIRAQAAEDHSQGEVIREYASGDADPNPGANVALTAAIEPVEARVSGPVFVVPPEHKQDSRGRRWMRAVGKALHIVPQQDSEEDAFRAVPDGE